MPPKASQPNKPIKGKEARPLNQYTVNAYDRQSKKQIYQGSAYGWSGLKKERTLIHSTMREEHKAYSLKIHNTTRGYDVKP